MGVTVPPLRIILLLFGFFLCSRGVSAAGHAPQPPRPLLLPVPSCGPGWSLDGKVEFYDRERLSDRINGEAELYFPYGFELLASGRYARQEQGFDLELYRVGSLLDAFGLYANYRPKGADPAPIGAEGAVTPTQLFFYQGRYFVRLQSTGTPDAGKSSLVACAQAVSKLLPAGQEKPSESNLLAIPEVAPGTVLYNATSLLGYDFFHRGMLADGVIAGKPVRLFIVLDGSAEEGLKSFMAYREYLRANGGGAQPVKTNGRGVIAGIDPLYGKVVVEQVGRFVFGIVRLQDVSAALPVMETVRRRVGK